MVENRVVITGIGVISPLGFNKETAWKALKEGVSGISTIENTDTSDLKVKIAGEIRNLEADVDLDKKELRKLDRFSLFALAAAKEAYADSDFANAAIDPYRFGVYVGSGIGGIQSLIDNVELLKERGSRRVSPLLVPMLMPNAATANISLAFQAKGPTMSITSACATSNNSIGEAYRAIKYGFIDAAFAGGTEAAINEVAIAGFSNAKALSQNNEQPTQASRPFHKDRDGFVIAEGSTVLILESLASAEKRGAAIYAEVTGYGVASDAYHIVATDPEGKGAAKAMEFALEDAGITAEDIDVISAHATSTPVGDASEEKAIRQVFTDTDLLVTANKSMTGHMLGAAGAFEAFALAKMLQEDVVTPTINLDEAHIESGLHIPFTAEKRDLTYGLSNSFGFGGHNAVLILKKYKADKE